ncbi:MAG: prolipoprotein diacylglyceryl transferase family protein [bacterium]
MLPIIFTTSYFTLYTYGVFACIALFLFLYLIWRYARMTPEREEDIFDVLILAGLASFISGRLAYVSLHWADFSLRGLSSVFAAHIYPGVQDSVAYIAFFVTAAVLFRRKRVPVLALLAHLSVAICAGLSVLSIGSLFSGTTVGTITSFPLRIKYAGYDGLRHVVGMYSGLYFALSAYVIHTVLMYARQQKHLFGAVAGLVIWLFAFGKVIFLPITEIAIYYPTGTEKAFDYVLIGLMQLTGLCMLLYHLKLYLIKLRTK